MKLTGDSFANFALCGKLKGEFGIDSQRRQQRGTLETAETLQVYYVDHRAAIFRRFRRRWRRHRRQALHQIRRRHATQIHGVSGSPREQHLHRYHHRHRHYYCIHLHHLLLLLLLVLLVSLPFFLPPIYSLSIHMLSTLQSLLMKSILIFNSQINLFLSNH